ncbi:MAG: hypothetical protein IVW36_11340 [Dehalococcoidia bacterium]|nr:hypothetical protein [Dehalococcoidia bacterium]
MRYVLAAASALVFVVVAALGSPPGVGYAAFHCMRIHAVKAGFAGNANVQYVELRMDLGGQGFVAGHALQFFDGSGTLKATFTFPANVANAATGDSILIATSEFNAGAGGGQADFVFTNANTAGVNGGDPLHPLQSPSGKVVWAAGSLNCGGSAPVDSVASGSAPADYGSATAPLPGATDARALRLNNLNTLPMNNSTEYALSPVSGTSFTVAAGNLASDLTTPRTNARVVLALAPPNSVGGVAEPPGAAAPASRAAAGAPGRSRPVLSAALAVAAALLVVACGGMLVLARRRRP